MKTFTLTAAAVAGLLATAASADAQYYRTGGYGSIYNNPSANFNGGTFHNYPTYNTSPYGHTANRVPGYTGPVGVGTFTPLGGTTIITPGGYSRPAYNPTFSSPLYGNSFSYPTYGNSYYSGYNSTQLSTFSQSRIRSRGGRR